MHYLVGEFQVIAARAIRVFDGDGFLSLRENIARKVSQSIEVLHAEGSPSGRLIQKLS